MNVSSTPDAPWQPLARRAAVIAAIPGLVFLVGAGIIAWSWRPALPARVAVHWGIDGRPNQYASLTVFAILLLAIGVVAVVGQAVMVARWGSATGVRRFTTGTAVWLGAFIATLFVGSLAGQRHLAEASMATFPAWLLPAAIIGPLVPAVVAALLAPADLPQPATAAMPAHVRQWELGPSERAVWIERTTSGPMMIVLVGVAVLATGFALITHVWFILALPVLLIIVSAAMAQFTVRVDATGLSVRSALGWPHTVIPAGEVDHADVVAVNPITEFGGLGWRAGRDGRVGVVLRRGPGLEVARTGGRRFVVTVADAAVGAALLNTYAARDRSTPPAT